ncbi:NAD(P)(+) transhydrogenase (Re/Si-specific) subunit beta [Nocardioides sp. C4-1]|uniref:NAD(P)(+) transhydrogenase (Re/Si-specific) subunit beta n=1 Tax=Nocardioides sp. C4-1 TaxID=3151851 RepID=UPI0032639A13
MSDLTGVSSAAELLRGAGRVVVVPGYGLAVTRAQHPLHELVTMLRGRGVDVGYCVHPVAGRVPGHLDAVLDTAGVPDDLRLTVPEVGATDVLLVVGASDVVNPDAGLAVVDTAAARRVVVLKRTTAPGYLGLDNPVLADPATVLVLGELGASVRGLLSRLIAT